MGKDSVQVVTKIEQVCLLISDKTDFTSKIFIEDKEGPFILAKLLIHQEDIIIIYALIIRAPKYMIQTLTVLKEKMIALQQSSETLVPYFQHFP